VSRPRKRRADSNALELLLTSPNEDWLPAEVVAEVLEVMAGPATDQARAALLGAGVSMFWVSGWSGHAAPGDRVVTLALAGIAEDRRDNAARAWCDDHGVPFGTVPEPDPRHIVATRAELSDEIRREWGEL
jgi:hypothetical protein